MDYAEVKALALADPRMKTLAEKENELTNLRIINNKYIENKRNMKEDIDSSERSIQLMEKQIKGTECNCKDLAEKKDEDFKVLRQILTGYLIPDQIKAGGKNLGTAWGYDFKTPVNQSQEKPVFTMTRNDATYTIESGDSASGNAQRVTNRLKGLDSHLVDLREKLETKKHNLEQLKIEMNAVNLYFEQIQLFEGEVKTLREQIDND